MTTVEVLRGDKVQLHKTRGRRYHPHGHGEETHFRPHIQHVEPHYTESDLDWNSRVRWLPHPRYSDAPFPEIKAIRFPSETRLLRSFPEANMESNSEWTFYPRFGLPVTYHFGKKCTINGVHVRNLTSTSEQTVPMMVGRKKQTIRSHSLTSPGNKPYYTAEYSPGFHRMGSTRPLPNFRGSPIIRADTFIPLQPKPVFPCKPFKEKQKIQHQEEELHEVKMLSTWRPASPILKSVFYNKAGKKRVV